MENPSRHFVMQTGTSAIMWAEGRKKNCSAKQRAYKNCYFIIEYPELFFFLEGGRPR